MSEYDEQPEGVEATREPPGALLPAAGSRRPGGGVAGSPEVAGADSLSPAPVPSGQVPPGAVPRDPVAPPGPPAEWPLGRAATPPPPLPWQREGATAVDLPPLAAAPGPRTSPAPHPRRGLRPAFLAGVVGGLVGAVVASGVLIVRDDDGSVAASRAAPPVVVGPSREVGRKGDIAAILARDVPAVVAIVADGGPGLGGAAGTGFVISEDGVIVTNNHVVEGADGIEARFSDGTSMPARVLGTDAGSDLAVLHVDAPGLPIIELGDSDSVQVGDDVLAIGNALALEGGLSVTRGIVSGLDRTVPTSRNTALANVIQTDAAINPGNSGGPLVDSRGRVIGINTAIADPSSAQNVGFAIPISQAKPIIESLRDGNRPAYLGVTIDIESDERGALIKDVAPGAPADRSGLRSGDVIVSIGGRAVDSWEELRPAIRENKPGTKVEVIVDRNGKRVTVDVVLEEDPGSS